MKRFLPLFVLAFATAGVVGCGGPEGVYKLDKEAQKKAAEADLEKKTGPDKEFGKAFIGLIDQMDESLELKKDGKAELKTSMPDLMKKGETKSETETGEWKADGDTITVKIKDQEMKCKRDGKKLECSGGEKDKESKTFFVKS
ncbi:MAG: hypothetical protein U0271_08630 [Polyangiaceae bacterium]